MGTAWETENSLSHSRLLIFPKNSTSSTDSLLRLMPDYLQAIITASDLEQSKFTNLPGGQRRRKLRM